MQELTEEQKREFDEWVSQRETELFEVEKFKKIGKENDFAFQTLSFMGKASRQMSLAFTLTRLIEHFPKELTSEFRDMAIQYHELQDKVRNLKTK